MKLFVLGAGLMGRAVVWDLSGAREVREIVVADFDRARGARGGAEVWAGGRRARCSRTCATRRSWLRNCGAVRLC